MAFSTGGQNRDSARKGPNAEPYIGFTLTVTALAIFRGSAAFVRPRMGARRPGALRNQLSQNMDCPIRGAIAEQIRTAIDGVSIVWPMCGEYDIASAVVPLRRRWLFA
jgi:hypothetical protein